MTNLIRWDPFSDLAPTMDRFFEDSFMRPWRMLRNVEETTSFPIEVSETDNDIEVKASLPGVDPDSIDIQVHDDMLVIKAEMRKEHEERSRNYYRQEFRYGMQQRAISLPSRVEVDRSDARYEDGVLKLKLPKSESARPKQIRIQGSPGGASRQTIEGRAQQSQGQQSYSQQPQGQQSQMQAQGQQGEYQQDRGPGQGEARPSENRPY